MDLKDLLATTPESLAGVQKAELTKHVRTVLRAIDDCLRNDKFEELEAMLAPSGDSTCINFSYLPADELGDPTPMPLKVILDQLRDLQAKSQSKKK